MASVQFYHLTTTPLERALPKLLEKVVSSGFRTLLVADSPEQVERLNELLWTYDPGSFLPHGSETDGNPDKQPVLLSTGMEPINGAKLVLVTNGAVPGPEYGYERILDIFDGNDPQAVAGARSRWTAYKQAGNELSYLRQTDSGGWEKKQG